MIKVGDNCPTCEQPITGMHGATNIKGVPPTDWVMDPCGDVFPATEIDFSPSE